MSLDSLSPQMLKAIDLEMQRVVAHPLLDPYTGLREMLRYHIGWEGEGSGIEAQGKRIRPLMVLLVCRAAGGEWQKALPAAAAVELLHNFSLVHDDIEDNSSLRRGRETLWNKWGQALAINAGDALFTLAYEALTHLGRSVPPAVVLDAMKIFTETCIQLTGGQHLDISYEKEAKITENAYWQMISGKTAALLAGCARLGALVAGASKDTQDAFGRYGMSLGLSFQVQDDWLGLWGTSQETGKSNQSDLLAGKKTLPVIYAIDQNQAFARRWRQGMITPGEVQELSDLLIKEGAQEFTENTAQKFSAEAIKALEEAAGDNPAADPLKELTRMLLNRRK